MLGKIINSIWPVKELLNYIFKKTLGDYITNDLDLNKIEVEIKDKTFICLTNLEINAAEINKKHLRNSPIKIINGQINKLNISFNKERIEISISEITIVLMPVFNLEKFEKVQNLKTSGIKTSQETYVENTIISSLLNSALSNLTISISNVCIKLLSYEAFDNACDNPTISLYISKIDYKKIEDKSNDDKEKLFFYNKNLIVDRWCLKINKHIGNDEGIFFNLNDEKSIFNFFCDNSCIAAMDNENNNSINIRILESENQILKIDSVLQNLEFMVNPLQLQVIVNILEVYKIIFKTNNVPKLENNNHKDLQPITLFSYKINNTELNLKVNNINFIITENNCNYETPKLWSFFEANFSKELKSVETLESHFAYLEDNYFFVNIKNMMLNKKLNLTNGNSEFEFTTDEVQIKYIEYLSKLIKDKGNKNSLRFSKIYNSAIRGSYISTNQSIYQSVINQSLNSIKSETSNSIYESALESDIILIEKYSKLLDYTYLYNSFHILNLKPIIKTDRTSIKLRNISSFAIKDASDNKFISDKKSYTYLYLEETNIDFHPLILLKAYKILYPNLIIINEILYYCRFLSKEDLFIEKLNTNIITEDKASIIEKDNGISVFSKTKSTFIINIVELNLSIFNFNHDKDCNYFSEFFKEYFNNNLNIFTKKDWLLNKINIKSEFPSIKDFSKEKLSLKLMNQTLIIRNKILNNKESRVIYYDFTNLFLYLANNLLFSYKNIDVKIDNKKKFLTEKHAPLKEAIYDKLKQESDFKFHYSKSKLKCNKWILKFRSKVIFNNDNDIYKKEMSEILTFLNYLNTIHNLENKETEFALKEIKNENLKFKKSFINVDLDNNLQFLLDIKTIDKLIKYFSNMSYTLNITKIFKKNISEIYFLLKKKIHESYNITHPVLNEDKNSLLFNIKEVKFFILDVKINQVCLLLTNDMHFKDAIPVLKLQLNKILITNCLLNKLNKYYISCNDLQLLYNINSSNFKSVNLSNLENNNWEPLIFKEHVNQNSHILGLEIELQEEVFIGYNSKLSGFVGNYLNDTGLRSKEENLDEACYFHFEEFLLKNFIPQCNIIVNISLFINDLILMPFSKESQIEHFSNIYKLFQKQNNNNQLELIELIGKRKVTLSLLIFIKNIILDLIVYKKETTKDQWQRLILSINFINFHKNKNSSKLIISCLKAINLYNLNSDNADSVLYNISHGIGKEESHFKDLGFVEILFVDYIEIGVFNDTNDIKNYKLLINSIELNFCKDSFSCLINIIRLIRERIKIITDLYIKEKQETEIFQNNFQFATESNIFEDENDGKRNSLKTVTNELQMIEDYCEHDLICPENFDFKQANGELNIKNRKRSSFDIIVKNQFLEDKNKNIEDSIISFKLSDFRFYIFKGSDFNFKDDIFKSNMTNEFEIKDYSVIENFYINDNEKSFKDKGKTVRSRKDVRDYDNHICLYLKNLSLECIFYKGGEKTLALQIILERLDLEDYVKTSKYKKLISKYYYEDSNPFINIEGESLKTKTDIESVKINEVDDSELYLQIQISPINILIDQYTLLLILEFFDYNIKKEDSELEKLDFSVKNSIDIKSVKKLRDPLSNINKLHNIKEHKKPNTQESNKIIFIRKVKIFEFFISFSYNSHELSLSNIHDKNYLEFLNFSNINDFRVILKQFDFVGCKTIPDVSSILISFWKEDITKNQIISALLSSVSILRPFTTVMEGFIDIFKQPYIYYRTEKSIKDGFSKGLKNFFLGFTSQSLFLGEKVNILYILGLYYNVQISW